MTPDEPDDYEGQTAPTYTVRVVAWDHGFELHIDGVGVTQCESLEDAERTVRDYLETVGAPSARTAVIVQTREDPATGS